MHERRFPFSQVHKLEDPERRKWLPPDEVIRLLDILADWTIADIGAGTGYFTLPMARIAAKVLAVDVEPGMLARIEARLIEAELNNVVCLQGEASATGLAGSSCDCILMANVWHEFRRPCCGAGRGCADSEAKRTPCDPRLARRSGHTPRTSPGAPYPERGRSIRDLRRRISSVLRLPCWNVFMVPDGLTHGRRREIEPCRALHAATPAAPAICCAIMCIARCCSWKWPSRARRARCAAHCSEHGLRVPRSILQITSGSGWEK